MFQKSSNIKQLDFRLADSKFFLSSWLSSPVLVL